MPSHFSDFILLPDTLYAPSLSPQLVARALPYSCPCHMPPPGTPQRALTSCLPCRPGNAMCTGLQPPHCLGLGFLGVLHASPPLLQTPQPLRLLSSQLLVTWTGIFCRMLGREHNRLFTTPQLYAQHWHVVSEHVREELDRHVENDARLMAAVGTLFLETEDGFYFGAGREMSLD